ncbi:unnamed protein product [Prunus armeniaca]|uniref:protein-serine/threonine phosphatase n=1 Tax=Prunus armeniaca TaxID=36596 RepID=A0A6J5WN17_PRUAR|nr:hypothetical protein GBA52_006201 [Prunus armeniaca]CAB4271327.1 unnamed protein product [Prunus armeniaca]CAB4301763.1 unnamed protein product [Prunus armeniaca]
MTRQRAELVSSKIVLRKEWEFDTPEQCRQRRRRRIEIRRARWSYSGHYYLPVRHDQNNSDDYEQTCLLSDYVQRRQNNNINLNFEEEEDGTEAVETTDDHHVVVLRPAVLVPRYWLHHNPMPEFGTISLTRRPDQIQINTDDYDTVFVKEDFCRLDFDDVPGSGGPMHFFAVYDGHGHPHVSVLCKQQMHEFVAEELRRVFYAARSANSDENLSLGSSQEEEAKWPGLVRTALERSFERMHRLAQDACSCGNIGHTCGCKPNINALPVAGSTAVVAILTAQHIVIANSGSTHAVLGRAGSPFPLSHDHKRERLFYHNGVRVYGILNMCHYPSPGDERHILKPVVTLEPEISIIKREAERDECLILANDGIWDVMWDDMACRVACRCLRDDGRISPIATVVDSHINGPVLVSSKSHLAASLLCRLAFARGSLDDMSVMVVDLKSG